jgi:serine/threonine protein kinase
LVENESANLETIFREIDLMSYIFFDSFVERLKEPLDISPLITSTEKLGSGSYGTVYSGKLNSKQVAIKKFTYIEKSKISEQYEDWRGFMKEYCIISKLQDTGVVGKLYGAGWQDTSWVMVLERHHIKAFDWKNHDANTNARTIKIIEDIFDAVKTIHAVTGYVHGDIKPENILLYIVDGEPKVRMIDFGLSEPVGEFRERHEYIQSIYWRAPDLLQALPCDLVLTDIWAIAIAAFDIMAGRCVMYEIGAKIDIKEDDMFYILMTKCMNRTTTPDEWVRYINDNLIDYANELYEKYIVDVDVRAGFS